MRVALYARVSTERQEERGTVASQLELLRAAARADDHDVVAEFVDDGYSGARLDRPALDRLRDAAEAGALDAVLCLCPDRLARVYAYAALAKRPSTPQQSTRDRCDARGPALHRVHAD